MEIILEIKAKKTCTVYRVPIREANITHRNYSTGLFFSGKRDETCEIFKENAKLNPLHYYACRPSKVIGIFLKDLYGKCNNHSIFSRKVVDNAVNALMKESIFSPYSKEDVLPKLKVEEVVGKCRVVVPLFVLPVLFSCLPGIIRANMTSLNNIFQPLINQIKLDYNIRLCSNPDDTYYRCITQLTANVNSSNKEQPKSKIDIVEEMVKSVLTKLETLEKVEKPSNPNVFEYSDSEDSSEEAIEMNRRLNEIVKEKEAAKKRKRMQDNNNVGKKNRISNDVDSF
jgi:hypothetical protein